MGSGRDTADFAVCFDAIDKVTIASSFRTFVDACLVALGLSLKSAADRQIEKIGELIYLTDPEAKTPIYSFTMTGGSMRASISSPLTADIISLAESRVPVLMVEKTLERTISLLNTSFDKEANPLQAFIAAWSALEIFVNASFKNFYEARWFKIMESGAPAAGRPVFERFKEVMSGRYRLTDKFLVISAMLDPDAASADTKEFHSFKKVRDDLFHASEAPERLPTEAVQALLLKYTRYHLDRGD